MDQSQEMCYVMQNGLSLTAVTAGLWLLLTGPAYHLAGTDALEGLSYAAGLCLVPGWVVLWFGSRLPGAGSPGTRVGVVLGGTVLRLLFVVGGVMGLGALRPELALKEFHVWVIVFYLATLMAETTLLLRQGAETHQEARSGDGRAIKRG